MIIPDVNLLIYAYNSVAENHSKAKVWWERLVTGEEIVALLPVVLFAFVRITTNAKVFVPALPVSEAAEIVKKWRKQPVVELLEPAIGSFDRVFQLIETAGAAGNLVTDAQIAAAAIEHDATVHTTDNDFLRFTGVRIYNPIIGVAAGPA